MIEQQETGELDIIAPLHDITITLNVSPLDLELAVATGGLALCPALMRAIVAAMVVDSSPREAHD